MNYRELGKSNLKISQISFGCMSLQAYSHGHQKLLHEALDKGINYFDTADLYEKGRNETILGSAFKGMRPRVILATKVGNQWRPDGSSWDWNPRKDYILGAVEESLKRLQTDYIDLYQLHGGTIEDPIDEIVETFEILKQQGKIRHYGISSIRPEVIRKYITKSGIVSVMLQYSLLDRRLEEPTLLQLNENEIGVLARGSLAKGLLVDKPAHDYLNHSKEMVEKVKKAFKMVGEGARSKTAVALKFVLQNPSITSAVVGIRTAAHLDAAVKATEAADLTTEEMELLRKLL